MPTKRKRKKKVKRGPMVYKPTPKELLDEDSTPQRAIRCYCWECSGENKAEVERCEITVCPLYNFRLGED